jgi:hypothetical protein
MIGKGLSIVALAVAVLFASAPDILITGIIPARRIVQKWPLK